MQKKNIFNINLIIDIVLKILYPPRCAGCDKILEEMEIKSGFCKACRAIIKPTTGATCMKCGKILSNDAVQFCPDCVSKTRGFRQAKAIFEYSGPIKDAMYRFKYSNRRTMADDFANTALDYHGRWIKQVKPKLIVPVPMFKNKQRKRGYNQAELFARALSKNTGIPVDSDLIIRNRNTTALKLLDPIERRQTLRQAFRGTKRFRHKADILLVDDIFTTGATVDEVIKTLRQAGAGEVYCLFICTGK